MGVVDNVCCRVPKLIRRISSCCDEYILDELFFLLNRIRNNIPKAFFIFIIGLKLHTRSKK